MIQVACPSCRGPLTAPEDLAGSVVQCPRCQCQMVLPKGPTAAPPPPPSAPSPNNYASPPAPTPAAPTKPASSGTAQMRSAYAPSKPTAEANPPPTPPAPDPSKSTSELTARFAPKTQAAPEAITSDKLPALHLAETLKAKKPSEGGSAARGPLLILALLLSTGMSLVMLFWNPDPPKPATDLQRDAWQELEVRYFGDGANSKPYQQLLRRAQQAHNQGDRQQETKLLRQVLDMLHAEQPNPEFGVTGYQTPQPPNDEHLEEQIMILLRTP